MEPTTRFFQVEKYQWTHPRPWEIIYWLAGELCNHLADEETHNADATTAD